MNVLYIDDDAANRLVLREILKTAGLSMREAADATAGLRMIEEGDFALILMDLRMPGMNGLTALRKLRARQDAKGRVPVLVVTADCTDGIREMCAAADADGVIAKPVAAAQLFKSIGDAIVAANEAVLH